MKKFLRLSFVVLCLALLAGAQTATVKHNVNLRPDPSTDNPPITTLKPPAQLDLVEPDDTDGYLHVETADGHEGWVFGKNIRITAGALAPPPLPQQGILLRRICIPIQR